MYYLDFEKFAKEINKLPDLNTSKKLLENSLRKKEKIYNSTGILHENIVEILTTISSHNKSVSKDYFLYVKVVL